jgi:hypothetical protein
MEEESVTLYISGHGSEYFNSNYKKNNNVYLMSFVGVPGLPHKMYRCVLGEVPPSRIQQLELIKNYYKDGILKGESQYDFINSKELKEKLRDLDDYYISKHNKNVNKLYGLYDEKDNYKYKNMYSTTIPVTERVYFLKPNKNENYNICRDTNGEEIFIKDRSTLFCPEYGITIVASTNPEDNGYTLVTAEDDIYQYKNNLKNFKILDTRDEDKEKIIREKSNINLNKDTIEHWRKRAYKSSSNRFFVDGKYITHNELIDILIFNIFNEKNTTLTDLTYLFNSMGFKNIYILDPTCRSSRETKSLKEVKKQIKLEKANKNYQNQIDENPLLYSEIDDESQHESNNTTQDSDTQNIEDENSGNDNVCRKLGDCVKKCVDNICEWVPIFKTKTSGGKTKKINQSRFPIRYLPKNLSKKDKKIQIKMLVKSKKLYKKNKYYTRKKLSSYKNKPSKHIVNARKIYKITQIKPSKELSLKTGCSISALNKIIKKGEGAYYSSGSRPNQTPQSWGLARLASSITAGKAAAVDYDILKKGCNHKKTAFILANKAKNKYKYGHSKTKKVSV